LINLEGKLMDVSGNERVFSYREKEITLKDRRKSPICV